jgi:RNA polymerase sigma factor (sigma-70 family)
MSHEIPSAGDSQRAERIFRAVHPGLSRYVNKLVGPHDAQDVVQDTFERFLRQPQNRSLTESEEIAWLYRVAHNRAIDTLRAAKKRILAADFQLFEKSHETSHEKHLIESERDTLISAAAAKFDAEGRGLLLYHLLRETHLPPEKIAASLGMAPRTCRRFMDKMFAFIQAELRERGYGAGDL